MSQSTRFADSFGVGAAWNVAEKARWEHDHSMSDCVRMSELESMMERLMKPLATKDDLKGMQQDIAEVKTGMGCVTKRVDTMDRNMDNFRDDISKLMKQVDDRDAEERTATG